MMKHVFVLITFHICSCSLGASIPTLPLWKNLSLTCQKSPLSALVTEKIKVCDSVVDPGVKQLQCLMFYDMSYRLCTVVDNELVKSSNYNSLVNEQDLHILCNDTTDWEISSNKLLLQIDPEYVSKFERIRQDKLLCGKLCSDDDFSKPHSNFFCKYYKWGSDVLKTILSSDVDVKKVEDSTPDLVSNGPIMDKKNSGSDVPLSVPKEKNTQLPPSLPKDQKPPMKQTHQADEHVSKQRSEVPNSKDPVVTLIHSTSGLNNQVSEKQSKKANITLDHSNFITSNQKIVSNPVSAVEVPSIQNKDAVDLIHSKGPKTNTSTVDNVEESYLLEQQSQDPQPSSISPKISPNEQSSVNTKINNHAHLHNEILQNEPGNIPKPPVQLLDKKRKENQIDDQELSPVEDEEIEQEYEPDLQKIEKQEQTNTGNGNVPLAPIDGFASHKGYLVSEQDDFPDQEDHFMSFFLTGIILVVFLYVLYHNKNRVSKVVLGLLVEGRQTGRRRHSRGHAYRRLDTLEQAMSGSSATPPSKIIY